MNKLSPVEIAQELHDLQLTSIKLQSVRPHLRKKFEELIVAERDKLPHNGLFHNCGNRQPMLERIAHGLSPHDLMVANVGARTSLLWRPHNIHMEVGDDSILVNVHWDFGFRIGLHSNFHNEVMTFLFAPDGPFVTLVERYDRLMQGITDVLERIDQFAKALPAGLTGDDAYADISARYAEMKEELQPLDEALALGPLAEFAREYCFGNIMLDLQKLKAKLRRKPQEAPRVKNKYLKALAQLESANKYALLSPDEAGQLTPWEELVTDGADDYLTAVASVYEHALAACDKSGTPYMRKKKAKILADMELCNKLKQQFGLPCFIDRSHFSATIDHFNVVMPNDMVWTFRIWRETPTAEECSVYIRLTQSLHALSQRLGRKVKFAEPQGRYASGKLRTSFDRVDAAVAASIAEQLKFLKFGRIYISGSSITLGVPVGNMEWAISLRGKDPEAVIGAIIPDLQAYMTLHKTAMKYTLAAKGIYSKRIPHL